MPHHSRRSNIKKLLEELAADYDDGSADLQRRKSKAVNQLCERLDDEKSRISETSLDMLVNMYNFIHEGMDDESELTYSDADTVDLMDRIANVLSPTQRALNSRREKSFPSDNISKLSDYSEINSQRKPRQFHKSRDSLANHTRKNYNSSKRENKLHSTTRSSSQDRKHTKSSNESVTSNTVGSVKQKIKRKLKVRSKRQDIPQLNENKVNLYDLEEKVHQLTELLDKETGITQKLDEFGKALQRKQNDNKTEKERVKLIERVRRLEGLLEKEYGKKEKTLGELHALIESPECENSVQSSMKSTINTNFQSHAPQHRVEGFHILNKHYQESLKSGQNEVRWKHNELKKNETNSSSQTKLRGNHASQSVNWNDLPPSPDYRTSSQPYNERDSGSRSTFTRDVVQGYGDKFQPRPDEFDTDASKNNEDDRSHYTYGDNEENWTKGSYASGRNKPGEKRYFESESINRDHKTQRKSGFLDESSYSTPKVLRSALRNKGRWFSSTQSNRSAHLESPVHLHVQNDQTPQTPSGITLSRGMSFESSHSKALTAADEQSIYDSVAKAINALEDDIPRKDHKRKIQQNAEIIARSAVTALKAGKSEVNVKEDMATLLEAYMKKMNYDDDFSSQKENSISLSNRKNSGSSIKSVSTHSSKSSQFSQSNFKWSNMSVAAAATVLQLGGSSKTAQAAASAVLQYYEEKDPKIAENLAVGRAATMASISVLSAGAERTMAAAVSIAVLKSASIKNSSRLLKKLVGLVKRSDLSVETGSVAPPKARRKHKLYTDEGDSVAWSRISELDRKENKKKQTHNRICVAPSDDGSSMEISISGNKYDLEGPNTARDTCTDSRRSHGTKVMDDSSRYGNDEQSASTRKSRRSGLPPRYHSVSDLDNKSQTHKSIQSSKKPTKKMSSEKLTRPIENFKNTSIKRKNQNAVNAVKIKKNGVFGSFFKRLQKKQIAN